MSSPFFSADEVEYAPRSFMSVHRRKIIGAVLLVVVLCVSLGVALPIARRSSSSSSTSNAKGSDVSAPIAKTMPTRAPIVPTADEAAVTAPATTAVAVTTLGLVTPKKDVLAGALAEEGACVYNGVGSTISMDAKVPVWPVKDESLWKTVADGVMFKQYEHDPNVVWQGDEAEPRVYPFRVAEAGKYLVSMLSSSPERTEFNDCWLSFPYGKGFEFYDIETRKLKKGGQAFYKAYQNEFANAVGAYHVDHHPHVFVTADELEPGTDYSLVVGGRASQFIIHRIFLTKCSGDDCAGSEAIQATLEGAARDPNVTQCTPVARR